MSWNIQWDDEFIVGGNDNTRLTPNFRLREFRNASGRIYVHWELVSVLQILRRRYAGSVNVMAVDSDGLTVVINAQNPERLEQVSDHLAALRLFRLVERTDHGIRLAVFPPNELAPILLENALETAFSVTASFETSGDRFQQVTGNFDGAGISFGPAQWNFGSDTLGPLLEKFLDRDEGAFRACFSDLDDCQEILTVVKKGRSYQVHWGNSISTGRNNATVVEPWRGYFQSLGRVEAFRAIMVSEALRKYGARALKEVTYLESLVDGISVSHLRCICAIYDLVIQQGSLKKAKPAIEEKIAIKPPKDEFELLRIAVEERGKKARRQYRADCISRRMGVLHGRPATIDGRERVNSHFYLLRNVAVSDPERARDKGVRQILSAVGKNIASGGAVFA